MIQTLRNRIPNETKSWTVIVAFGLTLLGTIGGLVGAMIPGLAGLVRVSTPDVMYIVSSRGVQFGFGVFALGFLTYTGEWARYARFRRPEPRDLVAIFGAFIGVIMLGLITSAIFSALNLAHEPVTGTVDHDLDLHRQPPLWPIVILAWYLLAAPAEELFYRGLIQTRLRSAFNTVSVIVLASSCFAFSHTIFSLLSGASGAAVATTFLELFGAGLIFSGLYELTDNLVPVAIFHAVTWTQPSGAINQLLVVLH